MKWALLSLVLSQGADAATTCHALRSGRFVESNPLMPGASCGRVIALKAATVAPLVIALPKLYRTHPRVAVALTLAPTGAASVAVTINLHRLSR